MYSRLTVHKLKQNVARDLASAPAPRPPYRTLRDLLERTVGKRLRALRVPFLHRPG